jgi:hypothetical protein
MAGCWLSEAPSRGGPSGVREAKLRHVVDLRNRFEKAFSSRCASRTGTACGRSRGASPTGAREGDCMVHVAATQPCHDGPVRPPEGSARRVMPVERTERRGAPSTSGGFMKRSGTTSGVQGPPMETGAPTPSETDAGDARPYRTGARGRQAPRRALAVGGCRRRFLYCLSVCPSTAACTFSLLAS